MDNTRLEKATQLAQDFLNFANKGVSPYHVVHESTQRLQKAGFTQIHETENWDLEKGGRYFFIRSESSLVAFIVGNEFDANNTGFKVIGAHTDSPCLRLAPLSASSSHNFHQTCVCTYGGGLWHTWFDRDLILAGRVVYKDDQDQLKTGLYNSESAILKVPNLAIHLTSIDERNKFAPNLENHLKPILASQIYEKLSGKTVETINGPLGKSHYEGLLQHIQKKSGISAEKIVDLDLCFADSQQGQIIGLNQEFISSPRLDNLFSSWASVLAITDTKYNSGNSSYVNMICLFDHEEIGSQSFQGADGDLLRTSIDRIWSLLSQKQQNVQKDSLHKTFLNSFLISADMAHSIHPNYPEKHKENHKIKLNEGVGIKVNHNQRYCTDSISGAIIKAIAEKSQVPYQEFVVKNDSPCGSTIGPIITTNSGIKGCDIGCGQWGMHSIRETCGVLDTVYYVELMGGFFQNYEKIAPSLLKC